LKYVDVANPNLTRNHL